MADESRDAGGTGVEPSRELETLPANKVRAGSLKIASFGVSFANGAEMMDFAQLMAKGSFAVPEGFRGNPGACLAVIADSVTFGINPFQLARETYVVNGQLAYQAKAVAAVLLARAPLKARPIYEYEGEGDAMVCTVTFALTDGTIIKHKSPKVGEIKVKNSPLWKSDQRQQLGYYTVRSGGRLHFPDVLLGIYDMDEAAEFRRQIDAEPARESVASRLPGPTDAILTNGAAIDREVNGHALAPAAAAVPEPSIGEQEHIAHVRSYSEAGVPESDHPMLEEIYLATEQAVTKEEVRAAFGEFEGAVEAASEAAQAMAKTILDARLAEFPDAKGKKAATLL